MDPDVAIRSDYSEGVETQTMVMVGATPVYITRRDELGRPMDLRFANVHLGCDPTDAANLGAALIRHARDLGVDIESECDLGGDDA